MDVSDVGVALSLFFWLRLEIDNNVDFLINRF